MERSPSSSPGRSPRVGIDVAGPGPRPPRSLSPRCRRAATPRRRGPVGRGLRGVGRPRRRRPPVARASPWRRGAAASEVPAGAGGRRPARPRVRAECSSRPPIVAPPLRHRSEIASEPPAAAAARRDGRRAASGCPRSPPRPPRHRDGRLLDAGASLRATHAANCPMILSATSAITPRPNCAGFPVIVMSVTIETPSCRPRRPPAGGHLRGRGAVAARVAPVGLDDHLVRGLVPVT